MPEPTATLTAFVRAYEQAANSHDITQLAPLIASEAVYWFSDGSHRGHKAILAAIAETFATIGDEIYQISELEWISCNDNSAACRYASPGPDPSTDNHDQAQAAERTCSSAAPEPGRYFTSTSAHSSAAAPRPQHLSASAAQDLFDRQEPPYADPWTSKRPVAAPASK